MQDNADAVSSDWSAKLFPGMSLTSGWMLSELSELRAVLQERSAEDWVPELVAPGQFFID